MMGLATTEDLKNEAFEELQRQREADFKAQVKGKIQQIVTAQKKVLEAQAELAKAQQELKNMSLEDLPKDILGKS